jgi:hypothetical protein
LLPSVKIRGMQKSPHLFTRVQSHKLAFLVGSIIGLSAGSPGTSEAVAAADAAPGQPQELPMKIHIDVDGEIVTATLDDTSAARDFAALLPLSLTLEDYAVVERISYLPRKLSVSGAPAGMTPKVGDITYYAPWGNLAIFVIDNDNKYARGLVRLGQVDTGLPALQRGGPFTVRIERGTE